MVANQLLGIPLFPTAYTLPPNTHAQNPTSAASSNSTTGDQLNLIAILVEQSLLSDAKFYKAEDSNQTLRQSIFEYANHVQNRIPNSKAFVVGVQPNESTFKIASTLEKIYFDGFDSDLLDNNAFNNNSIPEDNNKLAGVILVGDVPLPIVHEEGGLTLPSLYPYTDFYRKRYVYQHEQKKFIKNDESYDYMPEIWHGVIRTPGDTEEEKKQNLARFLDKNRQYSLQKNGYHEFDQRLFLADIPKIEESLNPTDYQNYQRHVDYIEETAFQRFNKHFLQEVANEVSAEKEPDTPAAQRTPVIDSQSIANMSDGATKMVIEKFMTPLSQAFQVYLGQLNETIERTGRWNSSQVDSPVSLITLRDAYMQSMLLAKTVELENQIKVFIDQNQEQQAVIDGVSVQVRTCNGNQCGPTQQFNFQSFIAGQQISNLSTVEQCGILRGQVRPQGVSIKENNSVQVQANRLYNRDTAIQSSSSDLVNNPEYQRYAGCTGNNMMSVNLSAQNIQLGPQFCNPDLAIQPLLDLKGSNETTTALAPNPNQLNFIAPEERCAISQMSFLQIPTPQAGVPAANNQFFQVATPGKTLAEVTNRIFDSMRQAREFTIEPGDPSGDLNYRLNKITRSLLQSTNTNQRSYRDASGNLIEFRLVANAKKLNSVVSHQEPTDQTLQTTCGLAFTPSVPADGIRFIEFYKNNQRQIFEYPNLFRISGRTDAEINQAILDLVQKKEQELQQITGQPTRLMTQFFAANADISEPILWRQLGIDEKHKRILEKYLGRDSILPSVGNTLPIAKPKGYEALHIIAPGNESGFEVGINAAKWQEINIEDRELAQAKSALASPTASAGTTAATQYEFKCGDENGVEIWEWFPQLIGCWIPNEIEKLDEAIGLNNSCGVHHLPKPQNEADQSILDKLENPLQSDDLLNLPADLRVRMNQSVLEPGQLSEISIEVVNANGDLIWGQLDSPLQLFLSDDQLGQFSQKQIGIFGGTGKVSFAASQKIGNGRITVRLGDLSKEIPIQILNQIQVQLGYTRTNDARPSYEITATLVDSSGNRINNLNTLIPLAAESPGQGTFLNSNLQIQAGVGKAKFFPNPKAEAITVFSPHPIYSSNRLSVPVIVGEPVAIQMDSPETIYTSEDIEIPIYFVDSFGAKVSTFDSAKFAPAMLIEATDATKDFAQIVNPNVVLKNGEGILKIKVGTESGPLNLIAKHPKLKNGLAEINIKAQVKADDLTQSFPQSLFAAMTGFAAGDIFTPDAFGPRYLVSGKSQAVFSTLSENLEPPVLTLDSTYKLSTNLPSADFRVRSLGDQLSLEVVDFDTSQMLLTGTLPLQFSQVLLEGDPLKIPENSILATSVNDRYRWIQENGITQLVNRADESLVEIRTNQLFLSDSDFKLKWITETDFKGVDLNILDDLNQPVANLKWLPVGQNIDLKRFVANENFELKAQFSGSSSADARGIALFNPVEVELDLPMDYGFSEEQKFLSRFAAGSPAGDAVRFDLPFNGILLGDPTIQLKNTNNSRLGYDNTVGIQIFKDTLGSDISALTAFDFNNDQTEDIAAIMQDGRVELLLGVPNSDQYKPQGAIAFLADGVVDLASLDFKQDGFEDLIISTTEGRLAVLNNEREVITRENLNLKTGQQILNLQVADMDQDNQEDLVITDSLGHIRIFYNRRSQLSTADQKNLQKLFLQNGTKVGEYGLKVALNQNLNSDLRIRFQGLPDPAGLSSLAVTQPNKSPQPSAQNPYGLPNIKTPSTPDFSDLKDFTDGTKVKPITNQEAQRFLQKQNQEQQNLKNAITQRGTPELIPTLPWQAEGRSENYFADVIQYTSGSGFGLVLTSEKKVLNLDRPNETAVDLKEKLEYTLKITADRNLFNVVIADQIPDLLQLHPESIQCEGSACVNFDSQLNDVYLFFSGFNLAANQSITFKYQVELKQAPEPKVILKKLTGNLPVAANNLPIDNTIDLLVSPPFNQTGQLAVHYSTSARSYQLTRTIKRQNAAVENALKEQNQCTQAMNQLQQISQSQTPSQATIDQMMRACGLDRVEKQLTQCSLNASGNASLPRPQQAGQGLTPKQIAGNVDAFLKGVSEDIANSTCSGGGCFPFPFNQAFLAPGSVPFAAPLFAFPTTLATPAGPVPVPSAFASVPTNLGATDVPGVYNSLIRFYTMPTLTGGLGLAMCWGPYAGNNPVPVPSIPVPYPPPIGNCLTYTVPVSDTPACKLIEEGITQLMQGANNVVSDATSGLSAISNSGLPVNVERANAKQGAGGLEIGLALPLDPNAKFTPPVKSLGNRAAPAYDALGGVISNWSNRQLSEISQKLVNLPTIRVIAPDVSGFFSKDWDQFNKLATAWGNNVSGQGKQAQNLANAFKGPSDFIANYEALEKQIGAFNTSTFEDLYRLINTIPLINVEERHIDLRFPSLSYGELKNIERDFQDAKLYYENELQKYKDFASKFECPEDPAGECVAKRVLNALVVDLDKLVRSIQKNINAIRQWINFPRQIAKVHQELANYLYQTSCILDVYSQNLGGWLNTLQTQLVAYAEMGITMAEIVKKFGDLFDVFVNFETRSNICTNDRYSNFGAFSLLGLVLPDLPILNFPKWPDLVLDFSDIQTEINVELPIFTLTGVTLNAPRIPRVELPEVPDVTNLNLLLQIPDIPVIPTPPELPKLPPLPAIPEIKLPTLPPPPKLPDVSTELDVIIPFVEGILQTWTSIKKSYSPVPEAYLKDHVTVLTNRPAYLIPLDLLKPQVADVALVQTDFNELRIKTRVYLGVRLKVALQAAEQFSKAINDSIFNEKTFFFDFSALFDDFIQKKLDEATLELINLGFDPDRPDEFLKENTVKAEKWLNETFKLNEWQQFTNEVNRETERTSQEWQNTFNIATKFLETNFTQAANQALVNGFSEFDQFIQTLQDHPDIQQAFRTVRQSEFSRFMEDPNVFLDPENPGKTVWGRPTEWLQIFNGWMLEVEDAGNKIRAAQKVLQNADSSNLPTEFKELIENIRNLADQIDQLYQESSAQETLRGENLPPTSALPDDLSKTYADKWKEIIASIQAKNRSAGLSVNEYKEKHNIPNPTLSFGRDLVDGIQDLRRELVTRSNQINDRVAQNEGRQDLFVWADQKINTGGEFRLADQLLPPEEIVINRKVNSGSGPNSGRVIAQAPQLNNRPTTAPQPPHNRPTTVACLGTCLIDPQTNQSVSFIPHFDQPNLAQTTFVSAGNSGQSHVVYSDGSRIYFKKNHLIPPASPTSKKEPVAAKIFNITDFQPVQKAQDLNKEALNNLSVNLVENGSAEFGWSETFHPDVYGYGIQLERSVLGHQNDQQKNGLVDLTVILLPPNEDGSTPRVTVGSEVVEYGTLITALPDEKSAEDRFGITPENHFLKADKVIFRTASDVGINLTNNRAVYFDQYTGPGYRLPIENGFYQIKMTWFSRAGEISTYTEKQLLAPQEYAQSAEPLDLVSSSFKFPVYQSFNINASELLTDLTGQLQYGWDLNGDDLFDQTGDILRIDPQMEPKNITVKLVSSNNLSDSQSKKTEKTFVIEVVPPEISLDQNALTDQNIIQGKLESVEGNRSLKDLPFSLFRKRWGIWKNLGKLKASANRPTSPPLQTKNGIVNSYFTVDDQGNFTLQNFTSGASNVIIQDQTKQNGVRVLKDTGQIQILDPQYEVQVVPASKTDPVRAVIKKQAFDAILANVYYVADGSTDIQIQSGELSGNNSNSIGVTISDRNTSDSIIAQNIPGFAPSFPGGATIFNESTQQNVALIDTDGKVRIMQPGFKLRFKNFGQLTEKVVFELIDSSGQSIFDIFIAADFKKLIIDPKINSGSNSSSPIGGQSTGNGSTTAKPQPNQSQTKAPPQPNKSQSSPFSDVDPSDSRFQAILNLFNRRIIEGFADGTFKPNAKITRAEFVKIALGATNCLDCSTLPDSQKANFTEIPFPDMSLQDWFFYCVSIAKRLGMVEGYRDGEFKGSQNISRVEAAAVLIRQSGIPLETAPSEFFLDVEDFAWYADYAYTAVRVGLIPNQNGFVFPNEEITRGEFAFMANLVLNLQDCRQIDTDGDGMPDWWENEHGLDPFNPKDADEDPDKDVFKNKEEFKNGTDPNDPNSVKERCSFINNANQNDTDLDGIIDVCDDDIDNDGIKNLLGIFDDQGLIIPEKVEQSDDNCVFVPNPSQFDSNADGVGDACLPVDQCPTIPEDLDGIDDLDGCPELDDEVPKKKPAVYVGRGPLCFFIDYENDFMPGDELMTAITDAKTQEIIYSQSNVLNVQ